MRIFILHIDEGKQNSVSHALEDQYKYMFTLGVVDARRLFFELEVPSKTHSLRFVDGRQKENSRLQSWLNPSFRGNHHCWSFYFVFKITKTDSACLRMLRSQVASDEQRGVT